MQIQMKFFSVPARPADSLESELNAFLSTHQILKIDQEFSSEAWHFCIHYMANGQPCSQHSSKREKKDYQAILSPEEFTIYLKLREWRKITGQKQGLSLFAIFTNDQLARIAQSKSTTKAALKQIEGVGDGRIEKYAAQVIEIVSSCLAELENASTADKPSGG